jgi:guanosine-3',5'-bis(diphosphate) 3'-pyrophosphohydrolase
MTFEETDISLILKALTFSAEKHKNQRRKGAEASPYINHPINVAQILWNVGEVREVPVIVAAMLHDTVEDTQTTPAELEEQFGPVVRKLVEEVTDDKSLAKAERKRLQIEHAPHLSNGAKQIKLADKISNIGDVAFAPPLDWSRETRTEYLAWADNVVSGLRGCNQKMEEFYDQVMTKAKKELSATD